MRPFVVLIIATGMLFASIARASAGNVQTNTHCPATHCDDRHCDDDGRPIYKLVPFRFCPCGICPCCPDCDECAGYLLIKVTQFCPCPRPCPCLRDERREVRGAKPMPGAKKASAADPENFHPYPDSVGHELSYLISCFTGKCEGSLTTKLRAGWAIAGKVLALIDDDHPVMSATATKEEKVKALAITLRQAVGDAKPGETKSIREWLSIARIVLDLLERFLAD